MALKSGLGAKDKHMNELSLYILDIAQNSLAAKSKNVYITITESKKNNLLTFNIVDDGCGMSKETLERVTSPFYTSRTTRKVGLGLPLFKELCEQCFGTFTITSEEGKGTNLTGTFVLDNIDLPPIGDIEGSLYILAINEQNIDIYFKYQTDEEDFSFSTKEIKEILDGVSLNDPLVLTWLKDYIKDGLNRIKTRRI